MRAVVNSRDFYLFITKTIEALINVFVGSLSAEVCSIFHSHNTLRRGSWCGNIIVEESYFPQCTWCKQLEDSQGVIKDSVDSLSNE